MKKNIATLIFTVLFLLLAFNGYTQPPPPPSGAGHGASGNQTGGSAPIGGGWLILLGLGVVYSGQKVYRGLLTDNETED